MQALNHERRASMSRSLIFALLLLSFIWGGSFYFIKVLVQDFGPWTVAFLRSAFGLVTIIAIMVGLRKPFGLKMIPWVQMGVMAIISTTVPWALIGFSETRLTSSMASVLNATTPLWTIIVGLLFFGGAASRMQWVGMGTAFVGLTVLLDVNPASIITVDPLGFVAMMGATVCYAVGTQLSKRLSNGLSMYQITFGTLLCALMASGSVAFSVETFSFEAFLAPLNLAMMVGLGVFGSGVAYIFFYYMVKHASPEFATMVTYLVPVSAILWGSLLLGEAIRWNLVTGLVFILGGVYMANRRPLTSRVAKT
jgi:drug/metabolite transporter (DMT)-like permease